MIKSTRDIEQDVLAIVKASVLGKGIKGKVYLRENRPSDSTAEDITIAHLTGTTNQSQKGVVIVNVWVEGIGYDGRIVANGKRVKELQRLVFDWLWDYDGDYTLSCDGNPELMQDADTHQYFINVRLAYSRMCS